MPLLEDCYCPRCSRYSPSSQVVHSTKAIHRKEFGAAAVERPFSSQFLNEFGSGTSSVHQTNTRPTSGSEDDDSRSNSNDTEMDPRSSDGDSVNIPFLSFVICAYYLYPNYF